ncbi:hypothetical protein MK280_20215 [Myxococcota bacterium]|nr:hypothetical protein [Myxococcota bacterium]
MGGRAAYALGTALFVGLGGLLLGYLSWLVHPLPEVVVVPILVLIGLEITAQAYAQIPRRHGPAVACVLLTAAAFSFFGVIHSPLPGGAALVPWNLQNNWPLWVAGGYSAGAAGILLIGTIQTTPFRSPEEH